MHTSLFLRRALHAGVATARREDGVLDDPRRLFVSDNVRRSSLEELDVTPQLPRLIMVHKAMGEDDESGVAPEKSDEVVVMAAEHNIIAG